MRRHYEQVSTYLNAHSWISIFLLIALAILYCLPALLSPFWVGNDAWSNLLPIIHYRDSIINRHTFPLFTDLWYGGRLQWQNPLWNFFYLPSTLVWLLLPLDWGTDIVYLGHLIFILLTARKLASLFLGAEIERISAAIILVSPALPAFTAGQSEKIMSWGWVLLALYFLLDQNKTMTQRGVVSGLCLGFIPITGSNYYTLYATILLLPLAVSFKDKKLLACFFLGALIGLVHLPSVWYFVGQSRANAGQSIQEFRLSFAWIFSSLSIGLAKPMGWETWAPIGIPMLYLFFRNIFLKVKNKIAFTPSEKSLSLALIVLVLLATSLAYQGHHLLDPFRVPTRAVAFVALVVTLFVLLGRDGRGKSNTRILLVLSALQVGILSFMIQPYGALYSPYDPQAQALADVLKADDAKSVWMSMRELNDMYIQVVLTQNGISLPNVYYGDMGQAVKIEGEYCGYSFDHLVALAPIEGESIELKADMEWSNTQGRISLNELSLVRRVNINGLPYVVYRVMCNQ